MRQEMPASLETPIGSDLFREELVTELAGTVAEPKAPWRITVFDGSQIVARART